jgi:hypothetical protein
MRTTLEGRDVEVEPVNDELQPVDRRDATMLKVVFRDTGEVLFYGTGRPTKVAPWTLRTPGRQEKP